MKLTNISTQTTYNTLRNSMRDLQQQLITAHKEVSTGQVEDVGLSLGSSNGRRVSIVQDIERLRGIVDTNNIAATRLEMTQSAIASIRDSADSLLPTLTTAIGGNVSSKISQEMGRSALASIAGSLNMTFNGEALFGGINSGEIPIGDYETDGPSAAVEAVFQSHFGFVKSDPAAASIDGAAMTDFLENTLSDLFTGTGWSTNFSSASDAVINARIGMNETAKSSVSANEQGFQNAVFAAVITAEFSGDEFGGDAKIAAARTALGLATTSASQTAELEGEAGLLASQIITSTGHMNIQIDHLTSYSDEMVAVDPYEAATRLNSLITQIETSYTLTGRIQRLSLMNYL